MVYYDTVLDTSSRRGRPSFGFFLIPLLLLTGAASGRASDILFGSVKVPFTWSVTPAEVRAGDPFDLRISRFSSREHRCELDIPGMGRVLFVCGNKAVAQRYSAPAMSSYIRAQGWELYHIRMTVCFKMHRERTEYDCGAPSEELQLLVKSKAGPARREADGDAGGVAVAGAAAPLLRPKESAPPPAAPSRLRVRSLDGIVRDVPLPAPESARLKKRKRFQLALLNDDEIRGAYDSWATLSGERRREVIRKVALLHSQVYGIDAPQVVFESLPAGVRGMFRNGGATIVIDDSKKGWDDPDRAFAVAAHEDEHHYQYALIARLDAGRLKPGDGDYEQAKAWKAGFADYCSPSSTGNRRQCGYEEYRSQSVESDAMAEGDGATRSLRSPLTREARP